MIGRLFISLPMFLIASAIWHAPSAAKEGAVRKQPLVIGETLTVKSTALTEERQINVYLPPEYAKGEHKFPVLYLIDGGLEQDFLHVSGTVHLGALWARSRSVIVVGIETRDRRRELVGPTQSAELLGKYPTAGSSSTFRKFIREEVMPAIAARYRVSSESGVIGESLAGLFIVETYLREPGLFTHYAAISPSLWWDDNRLSSEASALTSSKQVIAGSRLYLTMADEGAETQSGMDLLLAALRGREGWCYAPRPSLTHATIYHSVSPEALQYIFPDPVKPDPQNGFEVKCISQG